MAENVMGHDVHENVVGHDVSENVVCHDVSENVVDHDVLLNVVGYDVSENVVRHDVPENVVGHEVHENVMGHDVPENVVGCVSGLQCVHPIHIFKNNKALHQILSFYHYMPSLVDFLSPGITECASSLISKRFHWRQRCDVGYVTMTDVGEEKKPLYKRYAKNS